MPNNYLSVLYKHIIQVEIKNEWLKVCVGGGGGTNIPLPPIKKNGGHMHPLPTPHPPPRFLRQCYIILEQRKFFKTLFNETRQYNKHIFDKIIFLKYRTRQMKIQIDNDSLIQNCIILYYIILYYITLHYYTLHYITLHYITLHYSIV